MKPEELERFADECRLRVKIEEEALKVRYEEELVKEYEQEEIRRVLKLISTDELIKEIKHRVE